MRKKQAVAIFIVVVAVLGAAAFYLYQPPAPAVQDEFGTIDEWFSELDDFINFENQGFDYNLDEIAADYG